MSESAVSPGRPDSGRDTEGIPEDLRKAQERTGYISAREIGIVAERRGVPVSQVYAVASYFPHFLLQPPAAADVRVCDDMTCHLRGGGILRRDLAAHFTASASNGKAVQVRDISCVGRCDHAPVMSVNSAICENVTFDKAVHFIQEVVTQQHQPSPQKPRSPAERNLTLRADPYSAGEERYSVFRNLLKTGDTEGALAALKDGELKGMGGAGFPTYIKWDAARKAPGAEKYVICNADESEPGTIKDRFLLHYLPHLLLEGMMIASLIVGARRGYIYIRHEYEAQTEVLRTEIARLYAEGLLGRDIQGSGHSFECEVFVSPGGYICGEETALMEVIMGHRGEPRNKPPRTVQQGLWHMPTALNNVETFAFAVTILNKGPDWFKRQGRNGFPGLKYVGVTGDVTDPGVFEVAMGTTFRELIYEYAGGPLPGTVVKAFAPSGPSSGFLPPSLLDTALDWKTLSALGSMVGSGAVVVCSDRACVLDMALCAVRFYRNESCGKCVPCRLGTQKLVDMLTAWTQDGYKASDGLLLDQLSHALRQTSICGLGQIAPAPIQSVLRYFPDEVREHLEDGHCRAGICFGGVRA